MYVLTELTNLFLDVSNDIILNDFKISVARCGAILLLTNSKCFSSTKYVNKSRSIFPNQFFLNCHWHSNFSGLTEVLITRKVEI